MGSSPSAPCCPDDSVPQASEPKDYKPQGKMVQGDTCRVYIVGNNADGNNAGKRGILVLPDIFGIFSGRTRLYCDRMANELNAVVVMVDYFRGEIMIPESAVPMIFRLPGMLIKLRTLPYVGRLDVDCNSGLKVLRSNGINGPVGVVGYCFGGWVCTHVSSWDSSEVACVVTFHPSHKICSIQGEKEEDLLRQVKCPTFHITAGNDEASLKTGGLAEKIFMQTSERTKKSKFLEFPKMQHGWVNRGEISDPNIQADAEAAVVAAIEFLKEQVPGEAGGAAGGQ